MTALLSCLLRRLTGPAGRRLLLALALVAAWLASWLTPPRARTHWVVPASWLDHCAVTRDGRMLILPPTGNLNAFAAEVAQQGRGTLAQLWDTTTDRPRLSVTSDNPDASVMGVAPDGSWLLTGDRHRLSVVDGTTGVVCAVVPYRWTFAIAPDGRTLAVVDDERRLVLWNAATGQTTTDFVFQPGASVTLVFSRDSRSLAIFDGPDPLEMLEPRADGSGCAWPAPRMDGRSFIRVWDVATGRERAALAVPTVGSEPLLALTADGRRLATYHLPLQKRPAVLQVWDVGAPAAATVAVLPDGPGSFPHRASSPIDAIEFSPDGHLLVLRPQGHKGLFWDIESLPRRLDWLLAQDRTPISYGPGSCYVPPASPFPYLSPDGRWLLVPGHEPGLLELRPTTNVNRWRVLQLRAPEQDAQVMFSPDGQVLAIAGPGASWLDERLKPWLNQHFAFQFVQQSPFVVQLFDTATGTERTTWTVRGDQRGCLLGFAPTGRTVWTRTDTPAATGDGTLLVQEWGVPTGWPPAWLLAATALGVLLAAADWRRGRRRRLTAAVAGGLTL